MSTNSTNSITAEAATRTSSALGRELMLIGIFTGPAGDHILVRTEGGDMIRLDQNTAQNGLTLMQTGDGWAMITDGSAIHRLVMA